MHTSGTISMLSKLRLVTYIKPYLLCNKEMTYANPEASERLKEWLKSKMDKLLKH